MRLLYDRILLADFCLRHYLFRERLTKLTVNINDMTIKLIHQSLWRSSSNFSTRSFASLSSFNCILARQASAKSPSIVCIIFSVDASFLRVSDPAVLILQRPVVLFWNFSVALPNFLQRCGYKHNCTWSPRQRNCCHLLHWYMLERNVK